MSGVLRGVVASGFLGARGSLGGISKATWSSGPPRVRISLTEKLVSGAILGTAITFPGLYFLSQVNYYRRAAGLASQE